MRKLCSLLSVPVLFMLAFGVLSHALQAQPVLKDRIVDPLDHASMASIPGSLHPMARAEFDRGLADNAKVLQGLSINFKRTASQEAALKALLTAQQEPGSASYHKWLSPAQFGQQFGMSAGDLAKVSDWLQQQGFTVTSVAQSRNAISFTGSIANVEKAFQTKIHNYNVNGEAHFANATQISIPGALTGSVVSVRGPQRFSS